MTIDPQMLLHMVISGLVVAGLTVGASWVFGKVNANISDKIRQGIIAVVKPIAVGMLMAALFFLSASITIYGLRHLGTPAPLLKIVSCPGGCESPSAKKRISQCLLETKRYVVSSQISNIHKQAKLAVSDFTQCLAVEQIQVEECTAQEKGCLNFNLK